MVRREPSIMKPPTGGPEAVAYRRLKGARFTEKEIDELGDLSRLSGKEIEDIMRKHSPTKPLVELIVAGPNGHGKSSTLGRIVWALVDFDAEKVREFLYSRPDLKRKIGPLSQIWPIAHGPMTNNDRSWSDLEEITFGLHVMKDEFETGKYFYNPVELDGLHVSNEHLFQVSCGILVVSAKGGETDEIIREWRRSEEQTFFLRISGIDQVILLINKMDHKTVGYSEELFTEIKENVKKLIHGSGFNQDIGAAIPISSLRGENLTNRSDKMSWYNGPTFLEALDSITPPEKVS